MEVAGLLLFIAACAVVGRICANAGARIAENQEVQRIVQLKRKNHDTTMKN
jgi:hypothetical protein